MTNDNDKETPHLKCDVELDVSGLTDETANKLTAEALRKLADQIERDELDSGFHDVHDSRGRKVGEVYLDHYEYAEL